MRVLLACELYHPSVGGVQEVMRQVAEHLVARGHTVTVATSYLPERREHVVNGVLIVDFKAGGDRVLGLSGHVRAYRDFVLANEYDVFMIKAAQQWTFDALWPILDRLRRPIVFVPCGFSRLYEPTYGGYFEEMPAILRKFDELVFYASDYRDIDFARAHAISDFTVVPNAASEREFSVPADPGFRRRHGIAEDAFVIVTVGTLTDDQKGHRELAEAFDLVDFHGRTAVLVLNGNIIRRQGPKDVGLRGLARAARRWARASWKTWSRGRRAPDGVKEPLASLVARINRPTTRKHVRIVDLPRAELVQAYLNSDLFVFASNIEYSPLVLFEAAAAGLPFLTVPVGNSAEIASWTGGGVVCPAQRDERGYTRVDPVILAEHISRLAADPGLLDALGRSGRRAWSERFTWDVVSGQYESLFERLIARTRGS